MIFSIFIFITFLIEFAFWIFAKRNLDSSIDEKDLRRTVFVNDIINLFAGILARSDSYLDFCFIMAAHHCEDEKIRNTGIIIVILKLSLRGKLFFSAILKLEKARKSNNEIRALNLIAKIANICDFLLIGDIMDRFCPGNAKKIKRVCFKKLAEPIYMNIILGLAIFKLISEDFPQTILQILFVWVRSISFYVGRITRDMIIFQIAKNILSIFISLITVISLRPSFVEQADFDEKIEDIKVIMNSEEANPKMFNSERTSILKIKINKSNDFNDKLSEIRMSLRKVKKKSTVMEDLIQDEDEIQINSAAQVGNFFEEGKINILNLGKKEDERKNKYDFSFNTSDLDNSARNIFKN